MELIQRKVDDISQHVQSYLYDESIVPRPGAGTGVWLSFLLPTAVIVSASVSDDISDVYQVAVTISFGLLGSAVLFVLRAYTKTRQDYLCIVPPVFTYIRLYFYNKIGTGLSIAGGFASYTFCELVILLIDAAPKCLTYGEASILSQSLILFLFSTSINLISAWSNIPLQCVRTSTLILQVGIFGVLFICGGVHLFPDLRKPLMFYGFTLAMVTGFVLPLLHVLLQMSPVLWIVLLLVDNVPRMWLLVYWTICSGLGITAVNLQIEGKERATTVVRKYFHILAVVVYLPGLIRECCFLYLASGVVFALFVALELLRLLEMPPLGSTLQSGFVVFADEKDAGSLALTPLYLLVGCSLPLWLYPSACEEEVCAGQHLLPLMSGLLAIGVGDTAASAFGTWFGRTKWKGSKKTVEGTLASVVCQMALILLLVYLGYIKNSLVYLIWCLVAVIVTSVLEAKTDQVDNLALPLVMYIMLVPLSNYC